MTLTVTAARSFISDIPQMLVTINGNAVDTSGGGVSNAIGMDDPITSLVRIHADGSRWAVITSNDDPRLSAGLWTWLDTMAPYNSSIRYEVVVTGYKATSAAAFCTSTTAWLLSGERASLAFQIDGIKEISERSTDTRSQRFDPIGMEAIFISEGRRNGISGSMTLRVPVAREKALKALLATDSMVLINTPGTTGWDIGWLWVQPQNVSYSNPSNLVSYGYRQADISFEQGQQPYDDIVPVWTSGSAASYFAANGKTSAGVPALYANSLALVTNSRL